MTTTKHSLVLFDLSHFVTYLNTARSDEGSFAVGDFSVSSPVNCPVRKALCSLRQYVPHVFSDPWITHGVLKYNLQKSQEDTLKAAVFGDDVQTIGSFVVEYGKIIHPDDEDIYEHAVFKLKQAISLKQGMVLEPCVVDLKVWTDDCASVFAERKNVYVSSKQGVSLEELLPTCALSHYAL